MKLLLFLSASSLAICFRLRRIKFNNRNLYHSFIQLFGDCTNDIIEFLGYRHINKLVQIDKSVFNYVQSNQRYKFLSQWGTKYCNEKWFWDQRDKFWQMENPVYKPQLFKYDHSKQIGELFVRLFTNHETFELFRQTEEYENASRHHLSKQDELNQTLIQVFSLLNFEERMNFACEFNSKGKQASIGLESRRLFEIFNELNTVTQSNRNVALFLCAVPFSQTSWIKLFKIVYKRYTTTVDSTPMYVDTKRHGIIINLVLNCGSVITVSIDVNGESNCEFS